MEGIIVLINFNDYLGGGETLMVRLSQYLQRNEIKFLAFCPTNSYLHTDLKKKGIHELSIKTVSCDPNYYYLIKSDRIKLVNEIKAKIGNQTSVRFVTYCMRDLYTAFALSSQFENCSITHLILHIQDDLYVGQTLVDKIIYKVFHLRQFCGVRNIEFNRKLLNVVNQQLSLISMAEIISKLWNNNFGIEIPDSHAVPLPSFIDLKEINSQELNTKKIIWIGRFVDFKIPALVSMIHFINNNEEYSLTIIGDGDKKKIFRYLEKYSLCTKRISFIGEVPYNQLGEIIRKHSIGYAMGTSLIELAEYRIPVVIALASYDHKFFKKQICGGLFYDKAKGCDGSDLVLVSPENITTTINDVILEIESDYQKAAQACYNFAKEGYSEEKNFELYIKIINQAKNISEKDKQIKIPNSSFVRRFLFRKNTKR